MDAATAARVTEVLNPLFRDAASRRAIRYACSVCDTAASFAALAAPRSGSSPSDGVTVVTLRDLPPLSGAEARMLVGVVLAWRATRGDMTPRASSRDVYWAFVGVRSVMQGLGFGRRMLHEALAHSRTLDNVRRIWLHTHAHVYTGKEARVGAVLVPTLSGTDASLEPRPLRMYRALGFVQHAYLPTYYAAAHGPPRLPQRDAACVMALALHAPDGDAPADNVEGL